MKLNKRNSEEIEVSWVQIVLLISTILMIFALYFLRYIFPRSPFVIKYFTGMYAGIFYVLLIISAIVLDMLIAGRRKKKLGCGKGSHL